VGFGVPAEPDGIAVGVAGAAASPGEALGRTEVSGGRNVAESATATMATPVPITSISRPVEALDVRLSIG